jgi:competence protein ComGC
MLADFWAVLDAAAWKPGEELEEKPKEKHVRFPLVELLVVITVIGVWMAFFLFSIPKSSKSTRQMQCSNHMKKIGLACQCYADDHDYHFPPAYTVDEEGKPLHSWRVLILPYIEQRELYEKIRLDEPWDSEYNRQFHAEAPAIFRCPGNPRSAGGFQCPMCLYEHVSILGGSCYSVVCGAEAAFFGSQTRPRSKALSQTIFLVERREPVNWMDPSNEITFDTACKGINVDAKGIGSYHPVGVCTALGDGSNRFILNTIDSETLRTMLTPSAE